MQNFQKRIWQCKQPEFLNSPGELLLDHDIGNMIVTQKYQRTVLNGDKIEKEIVEISGRKINILDVRKTIIKRSGKFMRIFTDEQHKKISSTEVMNEFSRINEFSQCDTNMLRKYYYQTKKFAVYSSLNVLA